MFNLVSVLLKNGLSESDTPLYGHPLYRDTPLIRTLSIAPSVSVLTGFDCLDFQDLARGWGGGGCGCGPTTVVPSHFQISVPTGL